MEEVSVRAVVGKRFFLVAFMNCPFIDLNLLLLINLSLLHHNHGPLKILY